MLSIRDDEAEECWRIVEPILDAWSVGMPPMQEYACRAFVAGGGCHSGRDSAFTASEANLRGASDGGDHLHLASTRAPHDSHTGLVEYRK